MNVNEMTAAECADWRAKEDGWSFEYNASKFKWWKPCQLIMPSGQPSPFLARTWSDHPYPLTLDGAAAALPEGVCGLVIERKFDWFNGEVHAKAYSPMGWGRCGALWIHTYGPDELTARYRLAVLCCMAAKETGNASE